MDLSELKEWFEKLNKKLSKKEALYSVMVKKSKGLQVSQSLN